MAYGASQVEGQVHTRVYELSGELWESVRESTIKKIMFKLNLDGINIEDHYGDKIPRQI